MEVFLSLFDEAITLKQVSLVCVCLCNNFQFFSNRKHVQTRDTKQEMQVKFLFICVCDMYVHVCMCLFVCAEA